MSLAELLVLTLVFVSLPCLAQAPDADWRTLHTKTFRVHYPAEFEAWTLHAAARLESIRQRVEEEVGYAPPQRIDVIVTDPEADSNGSAWPFLRWPRMVLYTNPPPPDSEVGAFRNWPETLLTHEHTHLAHLLRPSRNPFRRWLEATLVQVGPLTGASPRWLYEGYATLIEGRLTGAGRPHSDLRAAILRRWAQAGRLPAYSALSSGRDTWLGGSMAYLTGSAYLEWLEARSGRDSLPKLWRRMSARKDRSFDEAFRGVFGGGPRDLYDRFSAELTHEALEVERRLQPVRTDGKLFQKLEWGTGEPAVSPDGSRIAVTLRARKRPSRLVVWSTGPDDQEKKEWDQNVAELLQRDPDDVAPVRPRPFPRKPLFQLSTRNGATPYSPRWMPDGKSILFVRFEPDPRGFLHPDLFRWTLDTDHVDRITRFADVRDADPSPDGTWAVAVRNRHGLSELVRVDLGTGAVVSITTPSVEVLVDRPRISPDGSRVLYTRHRDGSWRVVIRDLSQGTDEDLPESAPSMMAQPAWAADGKSLFVAVGSKGFVDLWRYSAPTRGLGYACVPAQPIATDIPAWSLATGERLTRVAGAALAPAPSPDGELLYFLNLEPRGFDVRVLTLPRPASPEPGSTESSRTSTPPGELRPPRSPVKDGTASGLDPGQISAAAGSQTPTESAGTAIAVVPDASTPATQEAPPRATTSESESTAPGKASPEPSSGERPPRTTPNRASRRDRRARVAARELLRSGIALTPTPAPFAVEPVAPGKSYGLGRQEFFPLLGGSAGPSSVTIEAGARLGDLLGRVDTLFVGSIAPGGDGPRGATVNAAFRGWPATVRAQLFTSRETPSHQPQDVPGLGTSLDVTQSGALLDLVWARRTRTLRFALDAGGLVSSIDPVDEDSLAHHLAFVGAQFRRSTTNGAWRFSSQLDARFQIGETGDDGWTRYGGTISVAAGKRATRLELEWRRDWSNDASSDFDRLHLGGLPSSILPPDFASARIENPALPVGTLIGDRYESQRVELKLGPLPLPIFYERHRAWDDGSDSDDWLELLGAELHLKLDALPLVRAPGLELVLGVAGVFGDPLDGKTNFWFGTSFRP